MANEDLELLNRHRYEFRAAERTRTIVRWLQVVSGIIAGAGVLVSSNPTLVYSLTLLACLVTGVWSYVLRRSNDRTQAAHNARRSFMLSNGLGSPLSEKRRADLALSLTARDGKAIADDVIVDDVTDYYSTQTPPGNLRLCLLTQENAFWSAALCGASAVVLWWWTAISFVLSIALLMMIPFLPAVLSATTVCQVVCAFLSTVGTIDLAGQAIAFQTAATALNIVDERLEAVRKSPEMGVDVLHLFGDYNSIIERTPLIPTAIYKRQQVRLNQIWNERNSPSTSANPAEGEETHQEAAQSVVRL